MQMYSLLVLLCLQAVAYNAVNQEGTLHSYILRTFPNLVQNSVAKLALIMEMRAYGVKAEITSTDQNVHRPLLIQGQLLYVGWHYIK